MVKMRAERSSGVAAQASYALHRANGRNVAD